MEQPIPRKTFFRQVGTTLAAAAGIAYLPSVARASGGGMHQYRITTPVTYDCCRQNCMSCPQGQIAYFCTPSNPLCGNICQCSPDSSPNCFQETFAGC